MTNPDAIAEIDTLIKAWRGDEIIALRDGDAERAHDCRIRISAFQYLRERISAKAKAAA